MYRRLMTEQFLGVTFVNLVQRDIFEIELSKLNEVERCIDKELRKRNNAIISMSTKEIFSIVDEYSDFFSIDQNLVQLQYEHTIELKENKEYKKLFLYKLQRYFTKGIPEDINSTVMGFIEKSF